MIRLRSVHFYLVDQAQSSLFTMLVPLLAGRWFGPTRMAEIALALTAWLFIGGLVRAVLVEPAAVDARGSHGTVRPPWVAALGLSTIVVLVGLVTATVVPEHLAAGLRIAALAIPGLVIADSVRVYLLLTSRARSAVSITSSQLGAFTVAAALSHAVAAHSWAGFVGAWSVSAYLAAAVALLRGRTHPSPAGMATEVPARGRPAPAPRAFIGAEYCASFALGQSQIIVVALLTSATAVAQFRAGQIATAPASLLLLALAAPTLARAINARGNVASILPLQVVAGGAVLAYTVVCVFAAPGLLSAFIGIPDLTWYVVASSAAILIFSGQLLPTAALKAARSFRAFSAARFTASLVGFAALVPLTQIYGGRGAALGLIVQSVCSTGAIWIAFAVCRRGAAYRRDTTCDRDAPRPLVATTTQTEMMERGC